MNIEASIEFSTSHRQLTINNWKIVLWTDESKYYLTGPDDNLKVHRPKGKCLYSKYKIGTVKHGGGKYAMDKHGGGKYVIELYLSIK